MGAMSCHFITASDVVVWTVQDLLIRSVPFHLYRESHFMFMTYLVKDQFYLTPYCLCVCVCVLNAAFPDF